MSENMATVLVNAAVVLISSLGSMQFITFRIEKLEKKVEEHNNLVHRTFVLEETDKYIKQRLDKLEDLILN